MDDKAQNKQMFSNNKFYVLFLLILCIICIGGSSNYKDIDIDIDDHFYFNTSSSSVLFGNISLFCRKTLNVSLINPTNNSILIDKYHINDTQFTIYPISKLNKHSSINFSIIFTPIIIGNFWSHLSVHTDNGVLYLYLYGVGLANKYNIKPINNLKINTTKSITIRNPFNSTLIINNISFDYPQIHGLYIQHAPNQVILFCVIPLFHFLFFYAKTHKNYTYKTENRDCTKTGINNKLYIISCIIITISIT